LLLQATTYWVQATLPIKKNYARSHELHIVRIQVLPALHHAHLNTMDACHPFYKFHFFENYFIFIITTASTTPNGWQKKVGFTIHYTYQENVY
jgi:nitrate reductase gamma subunit